MYRLNPVIKHNAKIHKLLDNGYQFVCVDKAGNHLKHAHFEYQLNVIKKCNRGSKIVPIKSLLLSE